MREYGQIQCSFWTDPDIQQLSDGAIRLAAYLLTGPHSNALGCYRLPSMYLMADFNWTAEQAEEHFQELEAIGFCQRCEATGFVLLPKFLRWNPIVNGNIATARAKDFDAIPTRSAIHNDLCRALLTYGNHFSDGFKRRLEALLKGENKPSETPFETVSNDRLNPDQRRPEQNRTERDGAEQASCSPPAALIASLVDIPLNDGSEHPVTEDDVAEWAALYPAVDVLQELRAMRGWCLANPRQRKTRSGVARFINTWLAKEQNKGGSRAPIPGGQQAPRRRELGHD